MSCSMFTPLNLYTACRSKADLSASGGDPVDGAARAPLNLYPAESEDYSTGAKAI
jgi:hypothetical protein